MTPPSGARSIALAAVIVASGCVAGERVIAPAECSAPVVSGTIASGNVNNVLSMSLAGSVVNADSAAVRFGIGENPLDATAPAVLPRENSVTVPVLGLAAGSRYRAQLMAFSRCGTTVGDLVVFETGALPVDLPAYVGAGVAPSPGYVVFAAGSYGLVIDNTGRVVWYHRFPNGPGLNFQPQPNGRFVARPTVETGVNATWIEVDPLGIITRNLACARGLQARMHDMIAQPDGTYWLICDEIRRVDLSAQGRATDTPVTGTVIQRRSAAGEVLFEWSAFDHFSVTLKDIRPEDYAGTVINWTHGNALDLDSDGNLLVSFRNLGEVTKIDSRTGAVIWRMGGARNQFTFENSSGPPFARQHGLRADGAGQLVLLDNLGEERGSRVERYAFDEARRTARLQGAYASHESVTASLGGNTQSLEGGRTLASFGSAGAVEERDATGNLLWRLEGKPGYVFRAQRIRSLYKPGVGDPR